MRLRWQLAIRDSALDPTSKLIAHTLATYMDAEGSCWPGTGAIVKGSGLGRRTVIRHLGHGSRLVLEGWIRKQRGGRGRSSRYQAVIPDRPYVVADEPRTREEQVAMAKEILRRRRQGEAAG